MPLLKKICTLTCLLVFVAGSVFAQPAASFTANPEAGCVGEVVQFTNTSDLSGCSGSVTYAWNFGNGATSVLENPAITYTTSGSFNVSLTVTCSEGFDTYGFTIEILPTPDAGFETVSYSGCLPYSVQFNNTSTQGGGTVDQWYWTFGDGVSSTDENPTHVFDEAGNYSISLTATNVNGCFDIYELPNAIQVSDTPTVSFAALPQSHCQSPVDVFFDSDVAVSPGLGFTADWSFGDGGIGGEADMTHTYNSQGDFDVQLTITDDYGCQRVVNQPEYIHVHPVIPAYTLYNSDVEEITNGVVCLNEIVYFSCDNEGYNVSWNIDGNIFTSSMTNLTFTTSGVHNVILTVDPGGDCEASVSFQIEVEDPSPSYSMDPTPAFACEPPLEISFTGSAGGNIDEYHWLFGDGNDSYDQDPLHTYNGFGSFQPVLEVTTVNGCVGTYTGDAVLIQQPSAAFTVDTTEGCINLGVNAEYSEETAPSEITNYTWDFDDGSGSFNGTLTESHVYNDTGVFNLSLIVTDLNGCTAGSVVEVQVGDHQTPLFDYSAYPTNVCPLDSLNFFSISEDSTVIDDYEWLFGDTATWQWGTSTEHHQYDYTFDQDTGWVQVVHVVNHNGCRDSLFVPDLFYIGGPIVNGISVDHDCDEGNFYSMHVNLIEATEWDWWISNSSGATIATYPDVTDSTLVYDFPSDGNYMVHVLATNSGTGCEYEDSVPVNVIQPMALFGLVPSSICAGMNYSFSGGGSLNAEQYYWDFGDGTNTNWSENPNAQHSYNTVGDVDVTLYVQDINGCVDSLTQVLHVVGPEIMLNNTNIVDCTPFVLNLTGNVVAEDPVILIEIQVGLWDTTMDVSSLGQNSVPIDITHIMEDAGVFDVVITARTSNCPLGNTVTYEDLIDLTSIDAGFSASTQGGCVGTEVDFTPNVVDSSYSYLWSFGDSGSGTEPELSHTYDLHGIYSVELRVEDPASGCVSIVNQPDLIEIQQAFADFDVSPTSASCPPLQPSITNNGGELYGVTYQWTSGDNETSTEIDPDFTYNHAGEYSLHLTATTEFGCTAEAGQLLTVDGPSGELQVSDNQVCLNEELSLEIVNGEGIDVIEWTLGDGALETGNSISHTYSTMPSSGNVFHVVATLTGGTCDVQYETDIAIYDVHAAFSILNTEGTPVDTFACSPMEVDLVDISTGDDLSYTWTIEGMPGPFTNPDLEDMVFVNSNQADSVFDVTLAIENSTVGCFDDTTMQLRIGYVPDPNVTPDTIICENSSLNLHAEGGETYLWYPGLYLGDINVAEPLAEPEEDMTYYVTVTTDNGCVNTDSVDVRIQHPVNSNLSNLSDTIFIGESTSILIDSDQEPVIYVWTPDVASISCLDCNNPVFNPEEDADYQVCISDSLQCFTECYSVNIVVEFAYTLDIPSAFTPEGDPVNRIVFVRGLGIRNLVEFSIYNRWGEKLFTTDDINQGWDGYYNGKLQPVDTYVYYVEAEMYDGTIKTKKGHILLMQ